ncbi:MAG: WHG domain-containing protein [Myxococcota bacterium]
MPRYHHGDLARALVDAAVSILEKDGPHALTLRKAARGAGVSHAAPAHHFGDLRGLLSGVAIRGWQGLLAAMREAPDGSAAIDRMRQVGTGYIGFATANVGLFRAMFHPILAQGPSPNDRHQAAREATWAYVVSVVEDCQAEGSVRAGDAKAIARFAWSTTHGAAALCVEGAFDHSPVEIAQTMVRDLYLGLRSG